MNTGDRIKQRRIELGLSVDELAEKTGKSRATIYRYENGDIENMPTPVLEPLAKALETTPADLMGWGEYEGPRIAERDAIFEEIERIFKINGWSLSCESYDDDYFTVKNINGQTIAGLYDYELISRYQSLKKKGKVTADLLVSSETIFKKYLESLGYYIDRDEQEHKPFIHYGNGAVKIGDNILNDIRTKIDAYAKATIDSVILKLNEDELRKERKEKEKIAKLLQGENIYAGSQFDKDWKAYVELNAAHTRTDIDLPEGTDTSDDDIMDDEDF